MPRKPNRSKKEDSVSVVDYSFGDRTYQIDPERRKVYRQFVEIETSKALTIFASWRADSVRV